MPRCPGCASKFRDQKAVLSHMNQPLGSCHSHVAPKLTLSEELARYNERKPVDPNVNTMPPPEDNFAVYPSNGSSHDMEIDVATANYGVDDSNLPSLPFLEKYTGAAQSYGSGNTFMDGFDSDEYASARIQNLYYPFDSKDEWELASFLLLSNLSMSSINKFLSLALVSFEPT
jgi:hypothetical protein